MVSFSALGDLSAFAPQRLPVHGPDAEAGPSAALPFPTTSHVRCKMNIVHIEERTMFMVRRDCLNTAVTSKEDILRTSRALIREQGCSEVNIRSVASACGVSVGAIYNYFASKASLVDATIESIWHEIFHEIDEAVAFQDVEECVTWMYGRLDYGSKRYPDFFALHSLSYVHKDKPHGKSLMRKIWLHIREQICAVMLRDPNVRPDAFSGQFTAEAFAGILFSLLLASLLQQDYDPSATLEIVCRALY